MALELYFCNAVVDDICISRSGCGIQGRAWDLGSCWGSGMVFRRRVRTRNQEPCLV